MYGERNIFLSKLKISRERVHIPGLLDPDLDPYSNCGSGSGSRRAKMAQKNRKKYRISCFEVLDVLFLGLKVSLVAWASSMPWRLRDK
jgi:hypothetical protein